VTADAFGLRAAIGLVAIVTLLSGCIVAVRMCETLGHVAEGVEAAPRPAASAPAA
jgi:hypothetical protein